MLATLRHNKLDILPTSVLVAIHVQWFLIPISTAHIMNFPEVLPSINDLLARSFNLVLNIHQTVILRDSLATAWCTSLQMASPKANSEVCDEIICCLA